MPIPARAVRLPRYVPLAALFVVVAALAAACSVVPNPLATTPPPDGLHPNPPPVAAPTPTPTPNPAKLTELDRQRAKWAQAGLANYRLRLMYGCQCALGGGKPIEIVVRRGAVAEASMDGQPLDVVLLADVPATIDQLFDYAKRNAGAGKAELKYDDLLGYPTALGVDPDLEARDDEIRIVVLELAPGR